MAGNPLINNMTKPAGDPRFGQFGAGGTTTANPYGQQAQSPYGTYQQGSYTQQAPYSYENQQVSAGQLNDMYNAGTAGPVDTNRITINDIIMKTGLNLGLVVVGAVISWYMPILMFVGFIGGLVLGFVNALKKKVSPALVMTYSVMEGLLLAVSLACLRLPTPVSCFRQSWQPLSSLLLFWRSTAPERCGQPLR